MDIGSLFLILALFVLVALFVARPFLERKATAVSREEHELSSLLAERDRTLNALQELDFDFTLGKIPEEDYPAQRTLLLQRGANILRQLDTLQPQADHKSAEERLEAAIASRRAEGAVLAVLGGNGGGNGAGLRLPDDNLETLIAARQRKRQEKSAGFCHKCGGPLQQSDRFCPKCGTLISTR